MHSHMYFYAEQNPLDWTCAPSVDTESLRRKRMIADALIRSIPACKEFSFWADEDPARGIYLNLSPMDDVYVHADHVHWDIKYRGYGEQEHDGIMNTIRSVAATLERVAGYDFFESGCQGLNERGSVELMPDVLAGRFDVSPYPDYPA